jgi:hypothetical protein
VIVNVLQSLLIPTLCGFAVWRLFFPRVACPFLLELAVSFGLGLGILGQMMLLLGVCRVPLTEKSIGSWLMAFFALFMVMGLWRTKRCKRKREICLDIHGERDSIWWSGVIFIFGNLVYIFWSAMHIPLSEWDVIATHAFNAKILYYDGTLENLARFAHATYPLQIPFLLSWINMGVGTWDDQIVKLVFPCICLSFLIGQYYFLRDYAGRRWAIGGIVLLVSANFFTFHACLAYRDFTMLFFNGWVIMSMLFWRRYRLSGWLIISGLFAGFGSFTKLEGVGYVGIHLIVLMLMLVSEKALSLRQKFSSLMQFLIPSMSITGFYMWYKWRMLERAVSLQEEPLSYGFDLNGIHWEISAQIWERLPVIAIAYGNNLFHSGNWNIIWFLFILSLSALFRNPPRKEAYFLLIGIFCYFAIYVAAFLLTQHYQWIAQTDEALSRIILQYLPWVTTMIVLVNAPILYDLYEQRGQGKEKDMEETGEKTNLRPPGV